MALPIISADQRPDICAPPIEPGGLGFNRSRVDAGGVPATDPGLNTLDPIPPDPALGDPNSRAAALLSFWCQLGVRPPRPSVWPPIPASSPRP